MQSVLILLQVVRTIQCWGLSHRDTGEKTQKVPSNRCHLLHFSFETQCSEAYRRLQRECEWQHEGEPWHAVIIRLCSPLLHLKSTRWLDDRDRKVQKSLQAHTLLLCHQSRLLLLQRQRVSLRKEESHANLQGHQSRWWFSAELIWRDKGLWNSQCEKQQEKSVHSNDNKLIKLTRSLERSAYDAH